MIDTQLALARETCARILRPVVRLALALGLKQPQLQELLVELLLDEARRSWAAQGVTPNISQLSVTTGLNRKAVTNKVRAPAEQLPRTEMSAAARTVTLWLQWATDEPALRTLPLVADGPLPSFENLAWQATRGNVHHRALLEELLRLGMASEAEGRAHLRADAFVPVNDRRAMLAFLGDNARDHLQAAVANTLAPGAPFLERAVFAQGLRLDDCEAIHQRVRTRWSRLHHELTHEMKRAVDAGDGATGRIRVGIYAYYEDSAHASGDAASSPPSPP